MIATYAAVLAVCVASLALGQAALCLCGVRRWSWLAPAVGLALLCATCWATVRLPGSGAVSAVVVLAAFVAALAYLRGRVEGGAEALRQGLPVAAIALAAASLPFVVEGHFGVLGTGFNPDMSQHLLATDRLANGHASQLLNQGYPLGPHAVVAALNSSLGIGLVLGFGGLTVAAAILAPLTALAAFANDPPLRRTGAALVVGLAYLVASYFAQGAFKETIQALLVLAFVLALREGTRTWRDLPLRLVPAALIAIGSVYVYSFPALIWLGAIATLWAFAEWARGEYSSPAGGAAAGAPHSGGLRRSPSTWGRAAATGPAGRSAMSLAGIVFLVGVLPELGRMIDFKQFETFDPSGPGLGNLFGQVSPFTALGIWPSGDFRLAPGDGAAPAFAYYLGATFAAVLLLVGFRRCWRSRESAILAGALGVTVVYVAARLGGTPYTAAKALEIAAPLVTLTILLPMSRRADLSASPAGGAAAGAPHSGGLRRSPSTWGRAAATGPAGRNASSLPATGPAATALILYLFIAGTCSLLAFANAPVGPTSYSPALTGLRPLLGTGPTLFLAPNRLLEEEQGARYVVWELRGGRVCVEPEGAAGGAPPAGVRFVVTEGGVARPPFSDLALDRRAGPYVLWERRGPVRGSSDCPLIAVRQARQGP